MQQIANKLTHKREIRTYLVTGASGLVGRAVCEVIMSQEKKAILHSLSSKDGDLRDAKVVKELFEKIKPTHVIHLAARVGGLYDNLQYNDEFFNSNMLININVLSTAYATKSVQKVISCMSTCIFPDKATYPLTVDQLHMGLPHESNLGYSFAKRCIDVQNRMYSTVCRPFIGVIPCNLFGPHDNFNLESGHVLPALIHKCYLAKRDNTNFVVAGSGRALRQFLYSNDFAKILYRIATDDEFDSDVPIICAPKDEVSISDMAHKIAEIMDFTGNITFEENPYGEGQYRKPADGSELETALGDMKHGLFTDIDVALEQTINWFCDNFETCRK